MPHPSGPTADASRRTRDLRRAIVRLIQELEAIDWYHAPIGVVAVDVDQLILAWNGVAGDLLGVREWEALGTSFVDLFEEHDRQAVESLLTRCIATDTRCVPTVFARRRPDGSRQFLELTATGIRGRAGEPGATVLLQDVTERVVAERQLAEAERRYRTLVQGVDAIVWEADPVTLRFTFVSQRAEELLGYPAAEWLEDPEFLARVLHRDDRGRALAAVRTAVEDAKDLEVECRLVAANGAEVWVRDTLSVVRGGDGAVERVLGLIVDVTERKRTEEALARLYRRAEEEGKRKDEFLALLGHELRTPLSVLTGAVRVMQLGDREQTRAAGEAIVRATRRLEYLTRDLLDIAGVVSGKLQLARQPIDVGALVSQAVEDLRQRAEERGQTLTVRAQRGVLAEADPVRLAQVVTNLVENAIKYSAPRTACEIVVRTDGDEAVVVVRDEGRGLAPDQIERIFDPFYQVQDGGGLGLGLALVRRLVELHGGTVRASSPGLGRGSEFTVRLPSLAAGAPGRAGRPEAPRVLVVEDDPDMREIFTSALERAGYRVEVAEDGPRAIERAQARPPDAAIIDIGLPGLGGFEVAPRLRSAGSRRPYLVAISGYSETDDQQRARVAGFDTYLVKPVDIGEVVALLSTALGTAAAAAGGAGATAAAVRPRSRVARPRPRKRRRS